MSMAQGILIVEDERVLAQNMKAYLGRRSTEVRVAANGRFAMEIVCSFAPDVVVLDYGLPGENGFQFYLELVRYLGRRVGCVMITGYPLEKINRTANTLGIRHLLCKPFSLEELQGLVDLSAAEASGYAQRRSANVGAARAPNFRPCPAFKSL